jgi:hypothetical protein
MTNERPTQATSDKCNKRADDIAEHQFRSVRGLAVVIVICNFLVVGCGVPVDKTDRVVNRSEVEFGLLDPVVTTTTTTSTTTTTQVPPSSSIPAPTTTLPAFLLELHLVQNQRLVRVVRSTRVEPTDDQVIDALRNPTSDETSGGRRSILTDYSLIVSWRSGGGSAFVELGESFKELLQSDQILAIGQIVYSLTDCCGIGNVAFSLAGSPLPVPGVGGRLIDGPVSRDDLTFFVATPTTPTTTGSSIPEIVLPPSP